MTFLKKYRFFFDKNLFISNKFYLFNDYYYKIHNILKLKIGNIVFLFNYDNIEIKTIIIKYGINYVVLKKLEIFFLKKFLILF
ncbi:MAG TPA: hypothetical protein V8P47_01810 [Candidatus Azosocius sp. HAIN]